MVCELGSFIASVSSLQAGLEARSILATFTAREQRVTLPWPSDGDSCRGEGTGGSLGGRGKG